MAFLTRAPLVLAAAACIGSCASSRPLGHVEVALSETAKPGSGEIEPIAAQAFIDPEASRYAPHGLYMYFEFERSDGSHGQVELDVPTDAPEDAAVPHFEASYRELSGEQVRFASNRVQGQLVVPGTNATAFDASCACDDTGFALTFIDAGSDGETGTPDDAVRRLSFGRLGFADHFCRAREDLRIPDDLRVRRERCDAAQTASPPPVEQTTPAPQPATIVTEPPACTYGCYAAAPAVTTESGCGSESYDEVDDDDGCSSSSQPSAPATQPEPASGADDSSDSSSGGCEGDSSDSNAHGCDGDSSDDERASCSVPRTPRRMHRRGLPSSFAGTGLPLLLACLIQVARARAARRGYIPPIPPSGTVPGAT